MRTKFILFCLLATATVNAQVVTLLHTFDEYIYFKSYDETTQTSRYYTDNLSDLYGDAYYSKTLDEAAGTYMINQYGADCSLVSTKVFTIPTLEGYTINNFELTRTLFDDDPNTYEYLVTYYKYDQTTYLQENKLILCSENGNVLYDFGTNYSYMYAYPELHILNNEYRFIVERNVYDLSTERTKTIRDIYKVNNKKSARGLKQVPAGQMPKKIMIDNQIYIIKDNKVFDMQGRVMPQM